MEWSDAERAIIDKAVKDVTLKFGLRRHQYEDLRGSYYLQVCRAWHRMPTREGLPDAAYLIGIARSVCRSFFLALYNEIAAIDEDFEIIEDGTLLTDPLQEADLERVNARASYADPREIAASYNVVLSQVELDVLVTALSDPEGTQEDWARSLGTHLKRVENAIERIRAKARAAKPLEIDEVADVPAITPQVGRPRALTPRMIEAYELYMRGFTHKHIAAQMGLRTSTVAKHIARYKANRALAPPKDITVLALTNFL